MKMDRGELCPSGSEITTEEGCDNALKRASELGIVLQGRKHLYVGSWSWVPHQCSYQARGDQAFHFNKQETSNVPNFVNGKYKMICKIGMTILNFISCISVTAFFYFFI